MGVWISYLAESIGLGHYRDSWSLVAAVGHVTVLIILLRQGQVL